MDVDKAEISAQFGQDPNGASAIFFELTPEMFEMLKALKEMPHWKLYRKVLIAAKEGYFQAVLPQKEAIPMAKTIGMVSGINFAINQLPVLIGGYEAKRKKMLAEKKIEPSES